MQSSDEFPILPRDQHNEVLVNYVHPPDWVNPEPRGRYNLVVVGGGTAGLVTAIGAAGWDGFGRGNFDARFNTRLASLPDVSPMDLNDRAWEIAIDPESSHRDMQAALLLAERAVTETNRLYPTILDTLAEVQFQLGQPELAAETILEAIAREPGHPYYREQLRRFTGERKPGDRPEYSPIPSRPKREPLDIQERGLTV